MANQRNHNQRRPSQSSSSRSRTPQQRSAQRQRSRRRNTRQGFDLARFLSSLKPTPDFRPDSQDSGWLKMLHITQDRKSVV